MNERDYNNEWMDLQGFLESYQKDTVDQIEWIEEIDPQVRFRVEATIGEAVFQTHYRQLRNEEPEIDFIDRVNHNLENWFEDRPAQLSNLTTPEGELAWLPKGVGAPYVLDDEFESYDYDLIIYRPKDKPRGAENRMLGVKEAEELGNIPQEKPLNGLIKGLDDLS